VSATAITIYEPQGVALKVDGLQFTFVFSLVKMVHSKLVIQVVVSWGCGLKRCRT